MTRKALTAFALTLAAGCATATPVGTGPRARGTEAWSWRMNATDGQWNKGIEPARAEAEPATEKASAEPAPVAAKGKAKAAIDPWAWRLGKTKLAPARKAAAKKPAQVASAPKKAVPAELRTSPDDEEFLNKILDDNAGGEGGEITMAAMELPKAEKKPAAAPRKVAAEPEMDTEPAPAKVAKKKMTRAEKRRAKRLARLEAKKAKQIAAREARLMSKRATLEKEKPVRAAAVPKKKKPLPPEGFIDDEGDDQVAEVDEDSGDDEAEEDDQDEPRPSKSKSKAIAAKSSKKKPVVLAASGKSKAKLRAVKTDWTGQAVDDEDPLKSSKK